MIKKEEMGERSDSDGKSWGAKREINVSSKSMMGDEQSGVLIYNFPYNISLYIINNLSVTSRFVVIGLVHVGLDSLIRWSEVM